MRQGPSGRRPRGRPNRKQQGQPSRPGGFDGGSEGRIRGNAHQVYERYIGLARDALSAGDRLAAETYYQHAEHYFRILNSSTDPEPAERRPPRHDGAPSPARDAAPTPERASPAGQGEADEDRAGLARALGAEGQRPPPVGQGDARPQGRGRPRHRALRPDDLDAGGVQPGRPHRAGNGQEQPARDRPGGEPADPAPDDRESDEAGPQGRPASDNEPIGA